MIQRHTCRGRRATAGITEPQQRALTENRQFIGQRGSPPNELAAALGISHASAHDRVTQLVRKGHLRREPRKARGLPSFGSPMCHKPLH